MSPAELLRATAFRLRARRAIAHGSLAVAAGAGVAAALGILAKAGVEAPLGPLAATWLALLVATALAARALLRGAGLGEAAYALDRAAGGDERFATLLELAARAEDPFRAPLAKACAAIARRTSTSAVVPLRAPRALAPAAGVAGLLVVAALVAPRAGEDERRLRSEEAGRLRAVATAVRASPGLEVDAMRARLLALAQALEDGRLDPADLARALEEARAALGRARRQERLLDAAERLAAGRPDLARLAAALAPGAATEEAPRAGAALALTEDAVARGASARSLERLAAEAESDAARALAEAVARGAPTPAAQASRALLAEAETAGDRRAALSALAARLEAALRRLRGDAGEGWAGVPSPAAGGPASGSAEVPPHPAGAPATGTTIASRAEPPGRADAPMTGRPEARRALPPRLEAAAARYFQPQEASR